MSIDLEKYRAVARRWEHADNTVAAAAACLIEQLCDEVARLRLTDAEREAIAWLTEGESPFPEEEQRMATLRGLRERHAP